MGKLIIDGNQVFELDEECMKRKEKSNKEQQSNIEKENKRKYENRNQE